MKKTNEGMSCFGVGYHILKLLVILMNWKYWEKKGVKRLKKEVKLSWIIFN